MKKIIFALALVLCAFTTAFAQVAFEGHFSYNDKNTVWGANRMIISDYWTSKDEKWNIFSWNTLNLDGGHVAVSALIYGEYNLGKGFYAHAEARTQPGFDGQVLTPQVGFAYLLPTKNSLGVYITPKYVYNDVYCNKHDLQVSINSSYDDKNVYYEGYIDTNWIKAFNFFTEQKAYYKVGSGVQLGASVVINTNNNDYHGNNGKMHIQPYFSVRTTF